MYEIKGDVNLEELKKTDKIEVTLTVGTFQKIVRLLDNHEKKKKKNREYYRKKVGIDVNSDNANSTILEIAKI